MDGVIASQMEEKKTEKTLKGILIYQKKTEFDMIYFFLLYLGYITERLASWASQTS